MMDKLLRCGVFFASLFLAGTAHAACSVSSDPGAVARPLNAMVEADAHLIASMTFLPKLMHVDYDSAAKRSGCDLGQLAPGDAAYELWGDDSGSRQRKAVPAKKGAPVALILPVIDLMKAIDAQKQGKSAQVEGYLLATITQTNLTAWRYYTGMPDAATLKRDMAGAMTGGANGNPIFSTGADGKTTVFVPKG